MFRELRPINFIFAQFSHQTSFLRPSYYCEMSVFYRVAFEVSLSLSIFTLLSPIPMPRFVSSFLHVHCREYNPCMSFQFFFHFSTFLCFQFLHFTVASPIHEFFLIFPPPSPSPLVTLLSKQTDFLFYLPENQTPSHITVAIVLRLDLWQ